MGEAWTTRISLSVCLSVRLFVCLFERRNRTNHSFSFALGSCELFLLDSSDSFSLSVVMVFVGIKSVISPPNVCILTRIGSITGRLSFDSPYFESKKFSSYFTSLPFEITSSTFFGFSTDSESFPSSLLASTLASSRLELAFDLSYAKCTTLNVYPPSLDAPAATATGTTAGTAVAAVDPVDYPFRESDLFDDCCKSGLREFAANGFPKSF